MRKFIGSALLKKFLKLVLKQKVKSISDRKKPYAKALWQEEAGHIWGIE